MGLDYRPDTETASMEMKLEESTSWKLNSTALNSQNGCSRQMEILVGPPVLVSFAVIFLDHQAK